MSHNKKIWRKDYPDIWDMFKSGCSSFEIAEKYSVHVDTIRVLLTKIIANKDLKKPYREEVRGKVGRKFEDVCVMHTGAVIELWKVDPTIGDVKKHPEILEKYR